MANPARLTTPAPPSALRRVADRVAETLRRNGFQAYFAGGCVRDLLRGVEPKDYDVATDAEPEEVQQLFPRALAVGVQFGVVIVVEGEHRVEVATFRNDGLYSDGRRPDTVRFAKEAREDVRRRDFTVNGLLMDPASGAVLDFVEGRRDLERKLIRAIGDPEARFAEDRLRMLRAIRFAACLGFEIEAETFAAIRRLCAGIAVVSAERVRDELLKILCSGQARRGFELLDESGLLAEILPEITAMKGVAQPPEYHPEGDVWVHTLLMLEGLPPDCPPTLALGVLLHDVGKPPTFRVAPDRIRFDNHVPVGVRMAEAVCRRLRLSREQTEQVVALVERHMQFQDAPRMRESTLKRFLRQEKFAEHLELHRLDCRSSHGSLATYDWLRKQLEELPEESIRPRPLLSGDDLIAMGYRPGPLFKGMLRAVEDAQLEGRITDRESALQFVREQFKNVYILGINHKLQISEVLSFGAELMQVEQAQKREFKELLESLVKDFQIQFLGEEMEIESLWKERCEFLKNLATEVGKPVPGLAKFETVAAQIARNIGCDYAEIDMTLQERNRRGIPRNYTEEASMEEKERWNQVREEHMIEKTLRLARKFSNILIVCGSDHVDRLGMHFQQLGHVIVTRYVRDEPWYKEDWVREA